MRPGPKPKQQDIANCKELHQIGVHIRRLRLAKGYENYQLFAYDHGFAPMQYLRYEHGKNLQVYSLVKIAAAFNMDLKMFFSSMPGEEKAGE